MIRRVLLTSLFAVLVLGLCTGYFYHTGNYERQHRDSFVCRTINIAVRDSAVNRIITSRKIREILGDEYIGKPLHTINLNAIEKKLKGLGEILSCEVYATGSSIEIDVAPRTAAVRFLTEGGHQYYCDGTGYIFPVESNVNTPVVTGHIPLKIGKNFKGYTIDRTEKEWIEGILELTSYIEADPYWRKLTSHLYIDGNKDIYLYPTAGHIRFLWGKAGDTEKKFDKVALWYKAIAPLTKATDYEEVDLQFENQIICR